MSGKGESIDNTHFSGEIIKHKINLKINEDVFFLDMGFRVIPTLPNTLFFIGDDISKVYQSIEDSTFFKHNNIIFSCKLTPQKLSTPFPPLPTSPTFSTFPPPPSFEDSLDTKSIDNLFEYFECYGKQANAEIIEPQITEFDKQTLDVVLIPTSDQYTYIKKLILTGELSNEQAQQIKNTNVHIPFWFSFD